jgi:hypothetical protein
MMSASLDFLGSGTIPLSSGVEYSGGGLFRRYGSILVFLLFFPFLVVFVASVQMAEFPTTSWEVMVHVFGFPHHLLRGWCGDGFSGAKIFGGFGESLHSRWPMGSGHGRSWSLCFTSSIAYRRWYWWLADDGLGFTIKVLADLCGPRFLLWGLGFHFFMF